MAFTQEPHCLSVACAKMGLNFTSCAPKELFPSQELVSKCKEIADKNGNKYTKVSLTGSGRTGMINKGVKDKKWIVTGDRQNQIL